MIGARRSRRALLGVVAIALSVTVGLTAGAAEAKKKKGKAGGTVDITKAASLPILDENPISGVDGITSSTIDVAGKQFKKTRIRDVNVQLQVTGTGVNSISDLKAQLTAPNGATSFLFVGLTPGNLLGPVTFDDEVPTFTVNGAPFVIANGVFAPWQATVQPNVIPLNVMDDGGTTGTWTLTFRDDDSGNTNTLVSWRLVVQAGKAFKTK